MHADLTKKNNIKDLRDRECEEQIQIESAKGSLWEWWKGFKEKRYALSPE